MRILTVDDSQATRLFIKRAIDLLGYEFLEAANGKEGLDVIQRENGKIDLILLDWHMPVMSGIEMLEVLKSDGNYRHIPISMVTVELERDEIQKAFDMGATNYLVKPFSKVNLVSKIMEGLGLEM
jgi:two-component system chemotaxis response regulator CheY